MVVTLVLLLLALYAPLWGALLALFIVWHSHQHGLVLRRGIAIGCLALAMVNVFAPGTVSAPLG